MPCHAIGLFFFYYHHVTYRTPSHGSGHLVIYHECYGSERERLLLSGVFYLTLLPASFKASLGAGSSTSMLAGFLPDLRNIVPARLFVWITTIHKRVILAGLFKGHGWSATWRICSSWGSNSLQDKLNMSEALCFIPLATETTIN